MKNIKIKGFNNLELNCYLYEPEKPKAIIQIIHGMQEHAFRYNHFAEFLCSNGFIVLASDLRGHGRTSPSIDKLGYGEKDIFNETIEDQLLISKYLKEKYNLPLYIFGHSYGSFLTQKLVQVNNFAEKFIICGTGNGSSFLIGMGNFVAGLFTMFGLKNKKATTIEKLSIKGYGKKFEKGNWLTRDEKVFDEYQKDQYCGGSFPISFYRSFFSSLRKLNRGIKLIPKNKRLFLIVGDKDPVGENAKQVKKLHKLYIKKSVDSKLKIYPDCRHELINELNKNEVYNDCLSFFNE